MKLYTNGMVLQKVLGNICFSEQIFYRKQPLGTPEYMPFSIVHSHAGTAEPWRLVGGRATFLEEKCFSLTPYPGCVFAEKYLVENVENTISKPKKSGDPPLPQQTCISRASFEAPPPVEIALCRPYHVSHVQSVCPPNFS